MKHIYTVIRIGLMNEYHLSYSHPNYTVIPGLKSFSMDKNKRNTCNSWCISVESLLLIHALPLQTPKRWNKLYVHWVFRYIITHWSHTVSIAMLALWQVCLYNCGCWYEVVCICEFWYRLITHSMYVRLAVLYVKTK